MGKRNQRRRSPNLVIAWTLFVVNVIDFLTVTAPAYQSGASVESGELSLVLGMIVPVNLILIAAIS